MIPTNALTQECQYLIREVAEGFQCPTDYATAGLFGAASAALGDRVTSRFTSFTNRANLWIAVVGDSSMGKSEPIGFFFAPLDDMDAEATAQYNLEIQEWRARQRGGKPSNEDPMPRYHHMLTDNTTDESLLVELAQNGSICWRTDELRVMFATMGRYTKNGGNSAAVGNLMKAGDGRPITVTRKSQDPISIRKPCLSVIGTIQPNTLKDIMGNNSFTDDGLFQRFIYVNPDDAPPQEFRPHAISDHARQTWRQLAEWLTRVPAMELAETPEAYRLHCDTLTRWMRQRNEATDFPAMVSLINKMGIHLCRWSMVAAILAGKNVIDIDTMRYSVECCDVFLEYGERTLRHICEPPRPKTTTTGDIIRELAARFPNLNQSKLAEALEVSRQVISKHINNKVDK